MATPSDPDPGAVAGLDVERRVAGGDRAGAVESPPAATRGAVERLAADVDALVGVRAVAAEGEEAVEVGAGELDVCAAGSVLPVIRPTSRPSPVSRSSSSTTPGITR